MMPKREPNGQQETPISASYLSPINVEAEQAVIGAMIVSPEASEKAILALTKDDFYRENHQLIFQAASAITERNEAPDLVTIQEELQSIGALAQAGGIGYITALMNMLIPISHIDYHIKIVREFSTRRALIAAAYDIAMMAQDVSSGLSIEKIADAAQLSIISASEGLQSDKYRSAFEVSSKVLDDAEIQSQRTGKLAGISTGIGDLDYQTNGMQGGQLIVIAARPGIGKSAFAGGVAGHVAIKLNRPTLVFSLEMSAEQNISRLMAAYSNVKLRSIVNGKMTESEWYRLPEASKRFYEAPLMIDDSSAIGLSSIRSKCQMLKREKGDLGLVVIDYLQLLSDAMPGKRYENRNIEIGAYTRGLKRLAKDLNVPVILLSQMSRDIERRSGNTPTLADLRDSGSIESDADIVMFLTRNESNQENMGDMEQDIIQEYQLIVAKNRQGAQCVINLIFRPEYTQFTGKFDVTRFDGERPYYEDHDEDETTGF
jgi:replicative DNA helicase